ncbi:HAD family phosphatase [Vagococcus sp. CY52-2]|uniref:HAD family hydrolase n=1 Tax=Vagococcus sp. CY52-2 TaxID=2925838 RepID=UPI001F55EFC7|nr:HAD-IA family hydrolase [Vagococcus sp. CY52-2]UNM89287.1 HAD-IA family hydrolase [Vagococcus sp. CY52-2]
MTDNRLVIFDMDGVLIDSEKFYMKSEQRVVESFGKKASIRDFRKYCGMTQTNIWSGIKSDFDLSKSVDELKVQGKESLEYLFETEPVELISGVLEILKGLKEGNVPMAVASSTGKNLILEHLTQLGIKDYFSLIKSAEEVGASKPNPKIFLETAKEFGVTPDKCIVVEDSTNGILAAKHAEMYCLAFSNPEYDPIDQSKADKIIDDFRVLTPKFVEMVLV